MTGKPDPRLLAHGAAAAIGSEHTRRDFLKGTLAAGAVVLHELDVSGDICLMIGHEDRGLSPASLAACDRVTLMAAGLPLTLKDKA